MAPQNMGRVSPTAHYTAAVWSRHGLSYAGLSTAGGQLLYAALRPLSMLADYLPGTTGIERMLLQRHRMIDHRLAAAIESGRVGQVVEIAAGLSPRGLRFTDRYPEILYVEGDLPVMSAKKARMLARAGLTRPGLRLVPCDALAPSGPRALDTLSRAQLNPGCGTAVITEGLLSYLPPEALPALWARIAALLGARGGGLYLTTLHLGAEARRRLLVRGFRALVAAFSRGPVYFPFDDAGAVIRAAHAAGFTRAALLDPEDLPPEAQVPASHGGRLVQVLEAWVG